MGFLFSGIFWGGVLVLLGISIIIKVAIHIAIPVVRIVVALVLIYLGVRLLFGSFGCQGPFRIRCDKKVSVSVSRDGRSYKNVFGDETVDLTEIDLKGKDVTVDIETVFGNTLVKIDPRIPTEFSLEAIFGNASVPGSDSVNFGSRNFGNDSLKKEKPHLKIRAKAVFGNIEFVEEKPKK